MSQDSVILKAGSAGVGMRSRCLPQWVHAGVRFVSFQCFPWVVLAIAPLKLPFASGVERIHELVRYYNAIAKIDFVGVYGLLNDLLW